MIGGLDKLATLLVFVLLSLLLVLTYKFGQMDGKTIVQSDWQISRQKQTAEIQRLQLEYRSLETRHQQDSESNAHALAEAQKNHAAVLAQYQSEFAGRLRLAESRASVYQRQAQGGAAERSALAEHAAQLDRTLEEGRHLVRELRETLEQREHTIFALSRQIKADRLLLTN